MPCTHFELHAQPRIHHRDSRPPPITGPLQGEHTLPIQHSWTFKLTPTPSSLQSPSLHTTFATNATIKMRYCTVVHMAPLLSQTCMLLHVANPDTGRVTRMITRSNAVPKARTRRPCRCQKHREVKRGVDDNTAALLVCSTLARA